MSSKTRAQVFRAGVWAGMLLAALAGPAASGADANLRAGAATSNTSPWVGLSMNGGMGDNPVSDVHDELHARALVLDDGSTKLAFVVVDSCTIPRDVVVAAKGRIKRLSGIGPEQILISATHAHSCPTAGPTFQSEPDAEYTKFLAIRIADSVSQAVNRLAPARVGWGSGRNDRQVNNRRWRMKPGTVLKDPFGGTDRVRMNPDPGSPELVEPAGPIDPEVGILSVQAADGTPLALLANYSLHYVGGVPGGHASADYFGEFARRVATHLGVKPGSHFVGIMSNGTSGDINNINFRTPGPPLPPYEQIGRVAEELATEAARVAKGLTYHDHATLAARAEELKLKVRKPGPDDVSAARAVLAKAKGRPLNALEEVYARETTLLVDYPDEVDVTVQALRVGDLGVVAIPCEVFVEIGLELKAKSPVKPMFTIELANGYNGYLPTRAQHALGGYETWRARSSYLEVGAAEKITAAALRLLEAVK